MVIHAADLGWIDLEWIGFIWIVLLPVNDLMIAANRSYDACLPVNHTYNV